MVSRTKKKERRERKVVSARKRAEEHSVFERTSLILPEGVTLWQPKKPGAYRIDIIPYNVGEGNPNCDEGMPYFERTFFVHRGIGANNDSYVCSRKTFKKKCYVCEHIARLNRDPDADPELIKSLAPKERQLFNLIDHAERDKGIQVWDISFHLFGKFLDKKVKFADEEDAEAYGEFHSPDSGLILRIGADEKSFGGKDFLEFSEIEFKERKKQYDWDIVDEAHVLDELIREMPYDELKKIFLQTDSEDEDEDDEDEDDEPRAKKSSAKKKGGKKAAPTAEDFDIEIGSQVDHEDYGVCEVVHISGDGTSLKIKDEDGEVHKAVAPDEVELVEDEDEDPPPKKGKAGTKGSGKGSKKSRPEPDEDEDDDSDSDGDEDDEDEDDDPPPKSKKKSGKPSSKSSSKSSKKPKDDDEDDEDGDDQSSDEDEDEDEDDDPPPKSKKSSKGKASRGAKSSDEDDEDEDDWDDEDDDLPFEDEDEDEDEPPAKKSKAKASAKKKKK